MIDILLVIALVLVHLAPIVLFIIVVIPVHKELKACDGELRLCDELHKEIQTELKAWDEERILNKNNNIN